MTDNFALHQIERAREKLTRPQYRTLRGQALAGNGDAALRGLRRLLRRRGA